MHAGPCTHPRPPTLNPDPIPNPSSIDASKAPSTPGKGGRVGLLRKTLSAGLPTTSTSSFTDEESRTESDEKPAEQTDTSLITQNADPEAASIEVDNNLPAVTENTEHSKASSDSDEQDLDPEDVLRALFSHDSFSQLQSR